jgi:hypothetical protein
MSHEPQLQYSHQQCSCGNPLQTWQWVGRWAVGGNGEEGIFGMCGGVEFAMQGRGGWMLMTL